MLSETPDDAFLIYALALEEVKEGQIDQAVVRLESLLNAQPNYLGTYYQLGKLYEQTFATDKAIAVYKLGMEEAHKAKAEKIRRELAEALFALEDDD